MNAFFDRVESALIGAWDHFYKFLAHIFSQNDGVNEELPPLEDELYTQ